LYVVGRMGRGSACAWEAMAVLCELDARATGGIDDGKWFDLVTLN
jgi:hypothetical protein